MTLLLSRSAAVAAGHHGRVKFPAAKASCTDVTCALSPRYHEMLWDRRQLHVAARYAPRLAITKWHDRAAADLQRRTQWLAAGKPIRQTITDEKYDGG